MVQVNMHAAKTQLSRLVEAAEAGETVVIARNGSPVAEIVPYRGPVGRRQGGQWAGQAIVSPDFDDPMPEIEELFGT